MFWYRNPEDERIALYQQLAEITRERCGNCCGPSSCCDPMYCESTIAHAQRAWDQELIRTEHSRLPLMGCEGCTADPHLRPICSIYMCQEHLDRDPDFAEEYWELRDRIDELENRRFGRKRRPNPFH